MSIGISKKDPESNYNSGNWPKNLDPFTFTNSSMQPARIVCPCFGGKPPVVIYDLTILLSHNNQARTRNSQHQLTRHQKIKHALARESKNFSMDFYFFLLLYLTHTMTTLFLLPSAQQCSFAPSTPSSLSYNNPRERALSVLDFFCQTRDDLSAGYKHGAYEKIHVTIHRTPNNTRCQSNQFEDESKEQLPIHPINNFVKLLDDNGLLIRNEHKKQLITLWTDNDSDRNQFISSLIQIYYGQNTKSLLSTTTLPKEAIGLILYRYFNVIDLNTINVIEMASVLIPKLAIDCQVDMDKVSDIIQQNALSGRLFVNGTTEYMKPGPFTKLFKSVDNWKRTKMVFRRFWKEMNEWMGGADNHTNHSVGIIDPVRQFGSLCLSVFMCIYPVIPVRTLCLVLMVS